VRPQEPVTGLTGITYWAAAGRSAMRSRVVFAAGRTSRLAVDGPLSLGFGRVPILVPINTLRRA
jgi:hypothetical protein